MNQSMSPWMTIGETAKHIRMSVGFLRKCVRRRTVPFARAGTKALRFRREDIDQWLGATGCSPLASRTTGDQEQETAENKLQLGQESSRDDSDPASRTARTSSSRNTDQSWQRLNGPRSEGQSRSSQS